MADRSWMSFVMPIGKKHKGETLGMIRINDIDYLIWAADTIVQEPLHTELQKAMKYLEEVDPMVFTRRKIKHED